MMTRVKVADAATEEGYIEIFRKSLNLQGLGNVLEGRTREKVETSEPALRALERWAQDLRMEGISVAAASGSGRAMQRLVEQDALSEMLEDMSLSTLLYYVLAGEGRTNNESS